MRPRLPAWLTFAASAHTLRPPPRGLLVHSGPSPGLGFFLAPPLHFHCTLWGCPEEPSVAHPRSPWCLGCPARWLALRQSFFQPLFLRQTSFIVLAGLALGVTRYLSAPCYPSTLTVAFLHCTPSPSPLSGPPFRLIRRPLTAVPSSSLYWRHVNRHLSFVRFTLFTCRISDQPIFTDCDSLGSAGTNSDTIFFLPDPLHPPAFRPRHYTSCSSVV